MTNEELQFLEMIRSRDERIAKLEEQVREAHAALGAVMPAAIWFMEGPYGSSPTEDCLTKARAYYARWHGEAEK